MKTKILVIALTVSAAINLLVLGMVIYSVWLRKEFGPPVPGPRLEKLLNLSPEQRDRIRAMREVMAMETEPIRKELDAKRLEILKLLKEPEVNKIQGDSLLAEIANLQVQLELRQVESAIAIRDMLTPEQRKLFFRHMEEEFQRRCRHPMMPPPPGEGRPPKPKLNR